jgi:hypothetical protein
MLEHIIAAVILELAYLGTGLGLCFIGKGLLEKGITGDFAGEGQIASKKFRIVTSSPGLVFLICGLLIVFTAITTQAKFSEPVTDNGSKNPASLKVLAGTISTSYLAQSSPDMQYALRQYQNSLHSAMKNDMPSATLYLTRAVVLWPGLLRKALANPSLSPVVRDPVFESIVRDRFRLPLELNENRLFDDNRSSPEAAILTRLRLYIVQRRMTEETFVNVETEVSQFPEHKQLESESVTANRLLSLLSKNPEELLKLLENPKYSWILQSDRLAAPLRKKLTEPIGQKGVQ